MKNLKTIRKHKSTEEGFSLVMAAGFGLVIMMIGLTIVSRSINDSSVSASQKINNRSLAAAESGVSAYLSLLKNRSLLARRSSGSWTTNLPTSYTAADIATTQGWQNLVAGDSTKGQYKLIDYVAPDAAGKAILTVQGQVNQIGTRAIDDISAGKTTVQTIISVTGGTPPGTTRFPGLWLTIGPNNNSGATFNQTFNAYGLVTNTPETSLWTSPNAPLTSQPKNVARIEVPNSVSRTPPEFDMSNCLLPMPASFLNSVDLATRIPRNGDVLFPATGDLADSDGVYRYYASDLNLQGNTTVRFKASEKVIVYLQGDMITKGNIEIKPCDGAGTCNLNNFVIYGYKTDGQLLIEGTNTVGAFIIAPTYSAGVAGDGNGEGYKGALWARNWTSASNSNKFVVNQNGNETQNLACPYTPPTTLNVISQKPVPNP